jgi:ribose transport system substrate-binding protein
MVNSNCGSPLARTTRCPGAATDSSVVAQEAARNLRSNRWLPLFLVLLGVVSLSACSQQPTEKYLVVFSQCNNAEPYRAAQNAKMKELWSKYPDVKLVEMDAQRDSVRQIAQIETAIRMKPQLIIVAPNERAPLTMVMKHAMDEHIAVICLERDIVKPYYTSWIKVDNRVIGQMIGQYVEDYLKKKNNGEAKGNIIEIAGLKGVEAETNRKLGAHDIWDKDPGIKTLTEKVANWSQSEAKDTMTGLLSAFPNIDVVYGRSDPMAVGAYLAAREKGREKDMIFVSIDGLAGKAGGVNQVKEGILSATCIYPLCVDKAVEIGNQLIHDPNFKPDQSYTISSKLVTIDNADSIYK